MHTADQINIDPSVVFGRVLVSEYQHLAEFHFDLRRFDFEKVKKVLEQNGFCVQRDPENKGFVAAFKPDLQKLPNPEAFTPETIYHMAS